MRKSIYIQFLIVAFSLVVLFYVVLFHENSYIETPTRIGSTVGGGGESGEEEAVGFETDGAPVDEPEHSVPEAEVVREPAQQQQEPAGQDGPVETETNYQSPQSQENSNGGNETLYQ